MQYYIIGKDKSPAGGEAAYSEENFHKMDEQLSSKGQNAGTNWQGEVDPYPIGSAFICFRGSGWRGINKGTRMKTSTSSDTLSPFC